MTGIYHKDMERARAGLVDQLAFYRRMKEHDITVVFDGYKQGMPVEHVIYSGHVKVVYTRLGERADDFIKKTISAERREWIVVTADRDIADHAWATGSIPVAPERFVGAISRRSAGSSDATEHGADGEEHDERPTRKGSSYHLSRKEKAVRRVINKL